MKLLRGVLFGAIIAVGLVVAWVPAAASGVRPDDRAGARGIDVTLATPTRVDDRTGIRGVGVDLTATPVVDQGVRADDRAGFIGVGPEPVVVAGSNGFDWTDAAIGAGVSALLLVLAGGALAVAAEHHRRGGPGRPVTAH